ncbi:magnesium transporter CorA family protein [Paenibacillus flagellatus]|nr:magnesium transporter CorA family protein [Paenibacillus flagellatus]
MNATPNKGAEAGANRSWQWIRQVVGRMDGIEPAAAANPDDGGPREGREPDVNAAVVTETPDGEPLLHGTLVCGRSPGGGEGWAVHFRVTERRLVTRYSDGFPAYRLEQAPWKRRLDRCAGGHEAFAVLLAFAAEPLHAGLDGYESRLGELEQAMRGRNRKVLMNRVLERRHELIEWSLKLAPLREFADALHETFLDDVAERPEYRRLVLKLERIGRLLRRYEDELDTLLAMDDAVSSYRGNEIMKTLTIFTALCTPATVIGALWGMNFDKLPLAGWAYGFPASCAAVALLTAVVYVWLWRKGWTGELLRGRRSGL